MSEPGGRGGTVEFVILRAAVGAESFPDVEAIALALERLGSRGVISADGVAKVMVTLSEEMVFAATIREFGSDLSLRAAFNDTHPSEDPTE